MEFDSYKEDNVVAVIACGGKSERMQNDKLLLNYHGLPQYKFLHELLNKYFGEVYISIRQEQKHLIGSNLPVISDKDQFAGHGPVSGLLSAIHHIKNRSILFIGCDYPLLRVEDILKLSSEKDQTTSYFNSQYEPLLSYYCSTDFNKIISEFQNNNFSLNKILHKLNARKLTAENESRLISIDTREDHQKILAIINKEENRS